MFCPKCGKQVDEPDAFCRSCGHTLSIGKPPSTGPAQGTDAAGTVGVGKAVDATKRSGEATASLILGLLSFAPVMGLLAVILGHMAKASIRRSGGRLLGEGMAGVGLLLGYLSLAGWGIYVFATFVAPSLPTTSNRIRDNQFSAIDSLKFINTAAITYSSMYNSYPPSLAALGPPKIGNPNASASEYAKAVNAQAAGFIDEVLSSGTKSGYRFTYAPRKKVGSDIVTYTVHADPVAPGITGDGHYFTDESGVIRVNLSEHQKQADANSLPIFLPRH